MHFAAIFRLYKRIGQRCPSLRCNRKGRKTKIKSKVCAFMPGRQIETRAHTHTHTHTHTHFRVGIGKSRKHAEKNGWPEGRQACDGMKTKNKLRQARRTRSPLQHAARTGAARTGAGCREAVLRPTQRRLSRPAEEHENGRPTGK